MTRRNFLGISTTQIKKRDGVIAVEVDYKVPPYMIRHVGGRRIDLKNAR